MTLMALGLAIMTHAGGEHLMGTASAVSPTSITVTTSQGKDAVVAVDSATKIEKGKRAGTIADVKVGMRVVVHAMHEGEALRATLIKLPAD